MIEGTATTWEPPPEFDGFHVSRLIGAGGMGRVYLARDPLLERDVAVKFIAAERPEPHTLDRFLIEARAVARLHHPNVVSVYRVGEVDGRPYVACEFVAGKSLDQLRLPLPWREVLRIGIGLTRGLAAAQARGILHRDIKPGNIMVSDAGEVKLVDFGIAKLVDALPAGAGEGTSSATAPPFEHDRTMTVVVASPSQPERDPAAALTRAGTVLGTPRCLAPELWRGLRATPSSEVYSLGVVLYELCVGSDFRANPHGGVVAFDDPLPPLSERAPSVPPELARLIDRCVAIPRIRSCARRRSSASPMPSPTPRAARRCRRH
jgi:serine/threonine protein kinase